MARAPLLSLAAPPTATALTSPRPPPLRASSTLVQVGATSRPRAARAARAARRRRLVARCRAAAALAAARRAGSPSSPSRSSPARCRRRPSRPARRALRRRRAVVARVAPLVGSSPRARRARPGLRFRLLRAPRSSLVSPPPGARCRRCRPPRPPRRARSPRARPAGPRPPLAPALFTLLWTALAFLLGGAPYHDGRGAHRPRSASPAWPARCIAPSPPAATALRWRR